MQFHKKQQQQNTTGQKETIAVHTLIVDEFNVPLINRYMMLTKFNKGNLELKCTIDHINLTEIPKISYICFVYRSTSL